MYSDLIAWAMLPAVPASVAANLRHKTGEAPQQELYESDSGEDYSNSDDEGKDGYKKGQRVLARPAMLQLLSLLLNASLWTPDVAAS